MTRRRVRCLPAVVLALSGSVALFAGPFALDGRGSNRDPRTTNHASSSWSRLLRDHLARYPLAEAEDVYKFVHQSVYGPAHAVPSREEAKRYLDEELAAVVPGPEGEPLLEILSDEPALARLNLRPFVAAGGDRERLLDAFVATAAQVHGDPAVMRARLTAAAAVLHGLGRHDTARRLDVLAADGAAHGYPAAHHGAAYRDAYRPAYRVVLRSLLPGALFARPPAGASK